MAVDTLLKRHDAVPSRPLDRIPVQPSLRAAIVTCMDARIDLWAVFGLAPGEAHVLRNAGGVVTDDVIRSLAISQRKLGTREILLMHHTGCGMTTFTDEEFWAEVVEDTGLRPPWAVEAFTDPQSSVRQSLQRVRRSPYLLHTDLVRGFVLDLETGSIVAVE